MQTNVLKRCLERMNAYFRRQASSREFTIDPESHVIDRKNGTVKNLLRLTNKTLIGFQRININWLALLSGMFGLGFGYLAVQVDDGLTGFLGSYKQVVKDGLISKVLRSEDVKNNLSQTLLKNVFLNPEIQVKLHQALIHKTIRPLEGDLFQLAKKGIIQTLANQEIRQQGAMHAAAALTDNTKLVQTLALQFLGGQVMDKLLSSNVSTLLSSEQVSDDIAGQTKQAFSSSLSSSQTQELLYSFLRSKFIN